MKSILFIDDICPKPYDPAILKEEALGGTEATVIRIAEGLARTGLLKVFVQQHNREHLCCFDAIYLSREQLAPADVDYVISLRSPLTLHEAKKTYANSKHYLWLHDLIDAPYARGLVDALEKTDPEGILAVSSFHRNQILRALHTQNHRLTTKLLTIHNPIDQDLKPISGNYDPNKLVWLSSPHKGLAYALECFRQLRMHNPLFKLHALSPGYFNDSEVIEEGVIWHGNLAHHKAIDIARDALCLFYPNIVFPETFGLVLAEANAIGVPCLTHNFGAASEVVDVPMELENCTKMDNVINKVLSWHKGRRPIVKAKNAFRLNNVIKQWLNEVLL